MLSPVDTATLTDTTQTFSWNAGEGAGAYQLWVGTGVGGTQIGKFPSAYTTETSTEVSRLPIDGSTVYVRLYSQIGSSWFYKDYSYSAGP
jgi:hypothetical protein